MVAGFAGSSDAGGSSGSAGGAGSSTRARTGSCAVGASAEAPSRGTAEAGGSPDSSTARTLSSAAVPNRRRPLCPRFFVPFIGLSSECSSYIY